MRCRTRRLLDKYDRIENVIACSCSFLLSKVLLDKVNNCKLVVNKLNVIDTKFRFFEMETLAKLENKDEPVTTIVSTSESDIKFKFDFAKVYWNPRLSSERHRIVDKLNKSVDFLYDVFAGVGPFALFSAKFAKCKVLANDLNPESYKWLCENVELNKAANLVSCFNQDGADFIRTSLKQDLIDTQLGFDGSDFNRKYHVVMNLPDIAFQFLNNFNGLLKDVPEIVDCSYQIPGLQIHCYCFVKNIADEEDERRYVIDHAIKCLGHSIEPSEIDQVYCVRKVAPNKNMYRISFHLNQNILYGTTSQSTVDPSTEDDHDQSYTKRIKLE